MAVRRDYRSFAKASVQLLAPQVEALGFRPWQGNAFGRPKDGWIDAFFLQQSIWGCGKFCVNVGIHVPALEELWAPGDAEPTFGLAIAWRLTESGRDDDPERWYPAKDKQELMSSLDIVAKTLVIADSWFLQFRTFSDVVEGFRKRTGLTEIPGLESHRELAALNYGLLLLLDGAKQEALKWLKFAATALSQPRYWDPKLGTITYVKLPGTRQIKPTKDDVLRVKVAEAAILKAES